MQSAETKKVVLELVNEGRLEFILGGWVANDEACPTFEEILGNYMVGHEFLKNEMGIEPPKVAWLVDSFGHSAATPELMQKMGFESLVFSRVSENEKIYRKSQKAMEFMWKPTFESPNGQENSTGLFTHITHELY